MRCALLICVVAIGVRAIEIKHQPAIVAKKSRGALGTQPSLSRPSKAKKLAPAEASLIAAPSPAAAAAPSFYWAVLANWLYFLSLGFNLLNVPFIVRGIVDGPGKAIPSATAIALSGRVESVDKLLTFVGVGFLAALSDVRGRRPLMAYSALGFALTNLIQARTQSSFALLYLADLIDGCTSCMTPVCQAYVADCSSPSKRAANLGIFQGLRSETRGL